MPVAILCNLLRALGGVDVGTAGFDGFDQRRQEISEVYYYQGGHSRAIEPDNLRNVAGYVLSGDSKFPLADRNLQPGKLLSRLSGSSVVGIAAASALFVSIGALIWGLFNGLRGVLTWPTGLVGLLAASVVLVIMYLFSRFF